MVTALFFTYFYYFVSYTTGMSRSLFNNAYSCPRVLTLLTLITTSKMHRARLENRCIVQQIPSPHTGARSCSSAALAVQVYEPRGAREVDPQLHRLMHTWQHSRITCSKLSEGSYSTAWFERCILPARFI